MICNTRRDSNSRSCETGRVSTESAARGKRAESSDTIPVSGQTRRAGNCRRAQANRTAIYKDHKCNGCFGMPPSWRRPGRRRNPKRLQLEKATRHRAVMFGRTYRLSRLYRELTQGPSMPEGSQTEPFPSDGIGLYSKNSTVSHLQCDFRLNPDRQSAPCCTSRSII